MPLESAHFRRSFKLRHYRASCFLDCDAKAGVCDGRRGGYAKHIEIKKVAFQPCLIRRPVPGARDAVAKLAENDDRNRGARLLPQDIADSWIAIHEGRQRIGVKDHRRSSDSMTSNSSSIFACMR